MKHSWMSRVVFGLVIVITLTCSTALSSKAIALHILSFNIKGLPRILNGSFDDDRFHDIGQILAERKLSGTAPDVVLIQESFSRRSEELQKFANYPFVSKGVGRSYVDQKGFKHRKLLSSGLYILSKYPFVEEQNFSFPPKACDSWDCYSNKGAQLVSIRIPGIKQPIQILNTHLQAGRKFEKSREVQLRTLNEFVRSRRPANSGIILGGDFNTRPDRPSFFSWLQQSKHQNVGVVCTEENDFCKIAVDTDPEWILNKSNDQFFYSNGSETIFKPIYIERSFAEPYRGRKLSDHMGYEVIFNIMSK